ncbi:AMP-binding protein [Sporichthya sp.]|uniref:AMP-binding protein n=1 Tax=Sporichthya sp. TaxID=65475 RepID=UPI0017F98FEA|nr:AMP-binding protein [Sporichthya sp.]MBA3741460.1 AMP-binding protein [Sporichthya sp.]
MKVDLQPDDTVNLALERAVRAVPDRLFLDFSGEQYTYAEFDVEVGRLAAALVELGVGFGDRVITQLDNSPDVVKSWFAINRIGAVWVPINTEYVGEFLSHQVSDSGARVAITEAKYLPRFELVQGRMPELRTVLHRDELTQPAGDTTYTLAPLADQLVADRTVDPALVQGSDLAGLFYTAGTTGPSKGCMMSHHYLLHVGRLMVASADREPDEVLFTPLPLFHLGATALVLSTVQIAGSVAVAPGFSVRAFWAEVERTGAQVTCVMASMIPLLAQAPDSPEMLRCKGQIRAALGVPFTAELQEVWRSRFGVTIAGFNQYGLTEAGSATMVEGGRDVKPGTSGRVHQWLDVRIFDEKDREVPVGTTGEIVLRPLEPHVMFEGYWNRPEATLAQLRNLWFHTGDLGRFDEDRFLHFVDRKKDYMRRRGENISSFELESTFLQHPDISEAAVHAVFSELTEDDVKVTAVLHEGATLEPQTLYEWSSERIPRFALPRYIEFRTELPKNPVGRVLKYQLRDEGRTPNTWDRDVAPANP